MSKWLLIMLILVCSGCYQQVKLTPTYDRTVTWYISDDGKRTVVTEWHVEWPQGVRPRDWNEMSAVEPDQKFIPDNSIIPSPNPERRF